MTLMGSPENTLGRLTLLVIESSYISRADVVGLIVRRLDGRAGDAFCVKSVRSCVQFHRRGLKGTHGFLKGRIIDLISNFRNVPGPRFSSALVHRIFNTHSLS